MKYSRLKVYKLFFLLVFLNTSFYLQSQQLVLDGVISGYNYNPSKGLFKKGSKVLLEGYLDNVSIHVSENQRTILKTKTNNKGEFHLNLPVGKEYSVELTKLNYSKIILNIDLTNVAVNSDIHFWLLELILNSHVPKKENKNLSAFGTLGFNDDGFYFTNLEQKSSLFNKDIDYKPLISLIEESIEKNESNEFISKVKNSSKPENGLGFNSDIVETYGESNQLFLEGVSEAIIDDKAYNKLVVLHDADSEISITDRETLIINAKKQLEIDKSNAKTPLDLILIADREALIIAAENELVHLKEIIKQKDQALSLKNVQLALFAIVLILLIVMVLFILRSNKIKSKLNADLASKNKKISDSINYAVKIQNAILPEQKKLSSYIDAFILYKPKDKVSGDFYWFEEVDNKIVIAAIDCTGHGVPGAFMSMIGNTLMNNIILERKITSPKLILESLNSELQNSLRQDNNDPFSSQDGMDLSICTIDKVNNKITYAGAMNELYLLKRKTIEILDVTNKGVGGFDLLNKSMYSENEIDLEPGTQLYMLSDGYMDQFGDVKDEKFNLSRFKTLLLQCESKSTDEQHQLFESEFMKWKGEKEQTDDVLVIGVNL